MQPLNKVAAFLIENYILSTNFYCVNCYGTICELESYYLMQKNLHQHNNYVSNNVPEVFCNYKQFAFEVVSAHPECQTNSTIQHYACNVYVYISYIYICNTNMLISMSNKDNSSFQCILWIYMVNYFVHIWARNKTSVILWFSTDLFFF